MSSDGMGVQQGRAGRQECGKKGDELGIVTVD